ncbi:hypothetical protein PB2503_09784 [Parvularcula bermudensis HTCC2503]|uniref:Thioredoxin domain-containing protein n=1 Tax=Parvularcula bermudensis (strain ATCC BAA-594 / HTCC2503 / KCTC 12087) TaxID=314260 RepID=E0TDU3_PARBH|nr:DsbA family protein [Parvularcula bermudensis]ADM10009.1 hypothetical protein PB2503_09784 [Parvularcula bermudensis HTCC2503]
MVMLVRPTQPLLAVLGAVVLSASCSAQSPEEADSPSPASQVTVDADFAAKVEAYLLENPEIIIESVERYRIDQERLAAAMAQESARDLVPALLTTQAGHIMPAEGEAEVIVVEFFDYNCGFCRRATDFVFTLKEETPEMTLVLQELPVTHPDSRGSAKVALNYAGTADYVPLHRALMGESGVIDAQRALDIAHSLDLATPSSTGEDGSAATDSFDEPLDQSLSIAEQLGVDGTPAFLIASPDGSFVRTVSGFDPDAVRTAIATALETNG